MASRRAGGTVLLVVAVIMAAGCGGSDPHETSGRAEQILSAHDVNAYPEGTPEHALLDWWRHAQHRELQGFLTYFRRDVRREHVGSRLTRKKLELFAQALRRARPDIVETERRADEAVVWTRVRTRRPTGDNRYVPRSTPHAFSLVREDGEWRLADDFFFDAVVEARRESLRAED